MKKLTPFLCLGLLLGYTVSAGAESLIQVDNPHGFEGKESAESIVIDEDDGYSTGGKATKDDGVAIVKTIDHGIVNYHLDRRKDGPALSDRQISEKIEFCLSAKNHSSAARDKCVGF